ncbi:SMP-30/gluconolactonase/LRE family protein [Streptomyces sp. NPDC051976]|uniref:SMP-30/gluconolactonase/LRE family protein n=1 Tax=Streptomyces sp. NPDC051976 TaxID=3154947 RepID=UPI00344A007F
MSTRHRLALATLAGLTGLGLVAGAAAPAGAAEPPVSHPHVLVDFDFAGGQTPENIALEPDGAADESLAFAAAIVRITRGGAVQPLVRLPSSPTTECSYPHAHAVAMGIARDHRGDLYTVLCTGSADQQGIWRLTPGGALTRVAALPADGFPNGIAFDEHERHLYVTDSLLGTVSRVDVSDGTVTTWAQGPELAPDGGLGANGLKVHDGAVWVTDTERGTVLRIPVLRDGSAGPATVIARGLPGIDDIAFTGPQRSAPLLATLNPQNEVVLIDPADGTATPVLTAADGLSNPSSLAVRGRTLYVNSAAYATRTRPNLLLAHLDHQLMTGD